MLSEAIAVFITPIEVSVCKLRLDTVPGTVRIDPLVGRSRSSPYSLTFDSECPTLISGSLFVVSLSKPLSDSVRNLNSYKNRIKKCFW